MKNALLIMACLLSTLTGWTQTKIGGKVFDTRGNPLPYVNVIFLNSTEGTITDENGHFYLQSEKSYQKVEFSFMGFKTDTLILDKSIQLDLKMVLEENVQQMSTIRLFTGDMPKKNNPAVEILKKIWANRRENGVEQYKQYQFDKYEKIEFDLSQVDSSLIESPLFKGMRFIFDYTDTSRISGKTYLPIFINESTSKVYGDNILNEEKEILTGNRNSGFNDNHAFIAVIKNLYNEYNVYNNYLQIFDKTFVSPLSRTGVDVYNYALADSAFIDHRWCYKIVYYPRRENELTFKGEFWVNDTTWAIKKINLAMSKDANINWVNEIYIEQEFEVLNDSTFVMIRDHFMANFALFKKKNAHGVYGKRTSLYDHYKFNIKKPEDFYKEVRTPPNKKIYNRSDEFWEQHRLEELTQKERNIYEMLDTLKKTRAFQRYYDIGSILASGYINIGGFDYGPVLSTVGYNSVEGVRLRVGGRTYFGQNDLWRIEGFAAYGFKDHKVKYGISGKWLIAPEIRLKVFGGHRHDVEQLGASLTNTTDVLGRSLASSSLFTVAPNNTLSYIDLTSFGIELSPVKNFRVRFDGSHRTLKAASPNFDLSYYTNKAHTQTANIIRQTELTTTFIYTPGRRTTGYGVEKIIINEQEYPKIFLKYTLGAEGLFNSDFNYKRLQLFYRQPLHLGGIGKLTTTLEAGKTFGQVPLGLLSVVPGNQTIFSIYGSFSLLNYYEFVTDTYAGIHVEHNFNGRIFSRIPLLRELNLREFVGVSAIMGSLSAENKALNASTSHPVLFAPDEHPYWEWHVGVGNIFKVFRIDFHFRGNYFDTPGARDFGVTGSFGFYF